MPIQFEAVHMTTAQVHDATVEYIGRHLRAEDLYELHAVGMTPDNLSKTVGACRWHGEAWALTWDNKPVFIWGVNPHVNGVYGLWGFGTKETRRAMPAITRWGMKTWLPDFLARTKARRIEVRVPVSSVHSINWLKALGMIPECTLPYYSVIGEDFLQLAYTPTNFRINPYVHTGPIGDQSPDAAASHCSPH